MSHRVPAYSPVPRDVPVGPGRPGPRGAAGTGREERS